MLKKALSVALLGTCIAPSVFSASILNVIGLNHEKHMLPAKTTKNLETNLKNYTDFSGDWTGTCTTGSGHSGEEQTVTIQNDERSLSIGDYQIDMDTFINSSESDSISAYDNHMMLTWNASGQLIMDQIAINRATIAPDATTVNLKKTTFSLVNGQLIITGTDTSMPDGETNTFNCQFSKISATK